MTINTNTKNPALRTTTVNKSKKPVYCTDNGKRWSSATECAEDIGASRVTVYQALNGRIKTCRGLHLCYEEDVAGTQQQMSNSLATISTEVEAMRAELERLRAMEKIYTKRQKEEDDRNAEIARLTKVRERHQRAYDRYMEHVNSSLRCMEEIDRKLEDLKNGRK